MDQELIDANDRKMPIAQAIAKDEWGWNDVDPSCDGIMQLTLDMFHEWKPGQSHFPYTIEELFQIRDDLRKPLIWEIYLWFCFERLNPALKLPLNGYDCMPVWFWHVFLDFYVNAPVAAMEALQEMIGVEKDGQCGSGTRKEIVKFFDDVEGRVENDPLADNEVIRDYTDRRKAFYKECGYPENGGHQLRTDRVCNEAMIEVSKNDNLAVPKLQSQFETPMEPVLETSSVEVSRRLTAMEENIKKLDKSLEKIWTTISKG